MPRENIGPVNCDECRFNIGGYCKRNPPQVLVEGKNDLGIVVLSIWPKVNIENSRATDILGCFAGEIL